MTVTVYIWEPLDILTMRSSTFNSLTNRDVGHVSMQVKNTYISHRPSEKRENFQQSTLLTKVEFIYQNFSGESNINVNRLKEFINSIFNELDKEDKEFIDKILKELKRPNLNINKDVFKKYIILESVPSADSTDYTYEKEVIDRKRKHKLLKINGLNEDIMLDYYNSLKTPKYHPLTNNCSTFIADIIRKSLNCSSEYSSFCSFCSKRYASESLKSDNKLKNFFTYLKEVNSSAFIFGILLVLVSISTGGLFIYYDILADLSVLVFFTAFGITNLTLQNIPIWTPTLIEKFINQIKNQDPFLEQTLIKIINQDSLKNILNEYPVVEKILNQTKIKKCLNNNQ